MPRSPLDMPDPDLERQRLEEERRRDQELAQEIAARKRSTNERNVKLTVVLIASRKLLGKYISSSVCRSWVFMSI